jgi:hypothetical protein
MKLTNFDVNNILTELNILILGSELRLRFCSSSELMLRRNLLSH